MTNVHDQNHATQAGARLQVAADQVMPMRARRYRHSRVAVTGQVNQVAVGTDTEEINMLGATGGFADEGHAIALRECVDRARFARIGPAGERNFCAVCARQCTRLCDGSEKFDIA